MAARNITLSMPDDLVRRAKILAASRDTSVSALVAELLEQVVGGGMDYDEAWQVEEEAMRTGILRVGQVTWTRDDIHAR